jgi:hypothetical protein
MRQYYVKVYWKIVVRKLMLSDLLDFSFYNLFIVCGKKSTKTIVYLSKYTSSDNVFNQEQIQRLE